LRWGIDLDQGMQISGGSTHVCDGQLTGGQK
jgi:hypothetical protein